MFLNLVSYSLARRVTLRLDLVSQTQGARCVRHWRCVHQILIYKSSRSVLPLWGSWFITSRIHWRMSFESFSQSFYLHSKIILSILQSIVLHVSITRSMQWIPWACHAYHVSSVLCFVDPRDLISLLKSFHHPSSRTLATAYRHTSLITTVLISACFRLHLCLQVSPSPRDWVIRLFKPHPCLLYQPLCHRSKDHLDLSGLERVPPPIPQVVRAKMHLPVGSEVWGFILELSVVSLPSSILLKIKLLLYPLRSIAPRSVPHLLSAPRILTTTIPVSNILVKVYLCESLSKLSQKRLEKWAIIRILSSPFWFISYLNLIDQSVTNAWLEFSTLSLNSFRPFRCRMRSIWMVLTILIFIRAGCLHIPSSFSSTRSSLTSESCSSVMACQQVRSHRWS